MVTAEAGEDLILASADGRYAANQERAVSLAREAVPLPGGVRAEGLGEALSTPGQKTIADLCAAHGFHPSQIVKVLLFLARFESGPHQPVLVCLRGDQTLNQVKLANALSARLGGEHGALLSVDWLNDELEGNGVQRMVLPALPVGFLGPDLADDVLKPVNKSSKTQVGIAGAATLSLAGAAPLSLQPEGPRLEIGSNFIRLFDPTAAALEAFVCGGNHPDSHRVGVSWGGLGLKPSPEQQVDLREAQSGDRCLHDPSQLLEAARGIEVGHIFQLGRKYSEAMGATFTTEQGEEQALWMGCYGIGVSRVAQAAVEQLHDDQGICWPVSIAPFEVIVVIANTQDATQMAVAELLYDSLRQEGLETLLDDRLERAGVKFKDADLVGIPYRVVVGRGAASGQVEVVCRRGGDPLTLDAAAACAWLRERVLAERSGLA
jgi:prolyl-tRNA synthetase